MMKCVKCSELITPRKFPKIIVEKLDNNLCASCLILTAPSESHPYHNRVRKTSNLELWNEYLSAKVVELEEKVTHKDKQLEKLVQVIHLFNVEKPSLEDILTVAEVCEFIVDKVVSSSTTTNTS